ncbi:hypothetical protein AYO38_07750, partial [bacterium SCGC AG-212-C10]
MTQSLAFRRTLAGVEGQVLVRAGLLAALALLPAVFSPSLYDNFTLPKQSVLLVCAAIVLAGLVVEGEVLPRQRIVRLALLGWLGWMGLATLTGLDPRGSLTGVYQYREGLLTQVAVGVLFLGAVQQGRSDVRLRDFLVAGAAGLAFAAAYTALQATGNDPFDWWIDTSVRAIGSIGNSNELAAYAVIALAFAALGPALPGRWRLAVPFAVTLLVTFTVLESESRSGLGGLAAAFILFPAAALLVRMPRRDIAIYSAALLAGAVVALALSAPLGGANGSTTRVRAAVSEGDSSGSTRMSLIRGTVEVIRADPLLGAGQDGLYLAFPLHRPEGLKGTFEEYDLTVQSSHNWFLDTAANTGVPGLVALMVLLGAVAFGSLKSERRSGRAEIAFLWPAMAGYCAVAMLNPLSLAAHATFFVLLGYLAGRAERGLPAPTRAKVAPRFRSAMVAPACISAFVLAIILPIADLAAQSGWDATASGDFATAAMRYERAAAILPLERDYASRHARSLLADGAVTGNTTSLRAAKRSYEEFDERFGLGWNEALAYVAT